MSILPNPLEVITLSGGNLTLVAIVGAVAVIALVMAAVFRREVLAAGEGTPNMQSIALAVQEGASAFLGRQFKTLSIFAVAAFLLLLLLPAHGDSGTSSLVLRISRSIAFLAGAGFSALIGFLGMWLAVRANLRVAAAARSDGPQPGDEDRFPDRCARRHGHRRPRPARCGDRGVRLPQRRPDHLGGLRFRRGHAGDVHACRWRHLHQGGRRRRRPGRQGRAGHPRGRPAQRRDHRRQRRRQRG